MKLYLTSGWRVAKYVVKDPSVACLPQQPRAKTKEKAKTNAKGRL